MMKIKLERLEEIENERNNTFNNPNFLKWVKDLKVSKSYQNLYNNNTNLMMAQYNYSKKNFSFNKK